MQIRPPNVIAGLPAAMLLVVCLYFPVAVGIYIAHDGGHAREKSGLERVNLEGRVKVEPDVDSDGDLSDPYEGGHFAGEPDTDDYDFETSLPPQRQAGAPGAGFPRGGRVAIVLRGASFRGTGGQFGKNCVNDTESLERQGQAADSLEQNVIAPLERYRNYVDVILTDRECNLTDERLVPRFGKRRVKKHSQWSGGSQRNNIMWAVDQLRDYSAEQDLLASSCELSDTRCVAVNYNLILILRHDTVWTAPMDRWLEADFTKVLFPYACPKVGVHDLFTIVPGPYLQLYYNALHWKLCFSRCHGPRRAQGWQDWHNCLKGMVQLANRSSVGVVLPPPLADDRNGWHEFSRSIPWFTYGHKRQVC